ncbi:hypothetical protein R3W88_025724 [Solanum pinnatisectum]|uniref:RING-type domain-containing protein n=1 Tax=Solanum pinnatisectum TaxID=50273 RepID=A0AAV9M4J3_9SOLN|nr:hypothetical protein R3W88_025724 [Solanum pinnatisectum]
MQNKRRKLDVPIVIIDSSSSEEDDVDYIDNYNTSSDDDDDSCNNTNAKRKTMSFSNSRKKGESKMCHQCQRSDKERVVCCSKCKVKRYCLACINRWYPGMLEEDFLKACPVCRNFCNCISCLRLDGTAKVGFFQFFSLSNTLKTFIYCKLSGSCLQYSI